MLKTDMDSDMDLDSYSCPRQTVRIRRTYTWRICNPLHTPVSKSLRSADTDADGIYLSKTKTNKQSVSQPIYRTINTQNYQEIISI